MSAVERYRRKPGIAWREEPESREEALAALSEGRDAADRGTLIVVVAGQIFELYLLGAEIWKLCDGSRSVGEIVEELTGRYDVTAEELERDVREFLADVEERGWLEMI